MTGSTIFHLHFKSSGEDHYFGSIAAIYDDFTRIDIGSTANNLYRFGITSDNPYENKKVIIKKGENKRKKGGRKLPRPKEIKPTGINLSGSKRVNF